LVLGLNLLQMIMHQIPLLIEIEAIPASLIFLSYLNRIVTGSKHGNFTHRDGFAFKERDAPREKDNSRHFTGTSGAVRPPDRPERPIPTEPSTTPIDPEVSKLLVDDPNGIYMTS